MKATTFYKYLTRLVKIMTMARVFASKTDNVVLWLGGISIIVFKILSSSKVLEDELVF